MCLGIGSLASKSKSKVPTALGIGGLGADAIQKVREDRKEKKAVKVEKTPVTTNKSTNQSLSMTTGNRQY